MRKLTACEKRKRGCAYCAHMEHKSNGGSNGIYATCPHRECPYTVLDKYESYDDYLQSEDSKINIVALSGTEWLAGRVTEGATTYFPVVRRFGKDGLFNGN